MADLPTVTLERVPILQADVPIHGIGSPPEGDIYTVADLEAMAEAHRELTAAGELLSPAARGHFPASNDPAVGWLENLRVEGDTLYADQTDTPRKFAALLNAKGYRTRSVELKRVKSQKLKDESGAPRVFENVVSRLAWLGARIPAVRTLDEVVAAYEAESIDAPDDDVRVVVMYAAAEGTVVWDPKATLQAVRNRLQQALNPAGLQGPGVLYVNDVSANGSALVCRDWDEEDAWVVPFTTADDGSVSPAPMADWTPAEKTWIATSKGYEEALAGEIKTPADTRATMAESKYTDDQRRAFSEATSMELDKVTDEVMAAAGVAVSEPVKTEPAADESAKAFAQRVDRLERELADERTKRFEVEKHNDIDVEGIGKGRFTPGERESWEKAYESNPEGTRAAILRLPVNDDLAREYGSSDEPAVETDDAKLDKLYEAEYGGSAA